MDFASETLVPSELSPSWAPSADFKLTRLARNFRSVQIMKRESHILIVGSISRNSFYGNEFDVVIKRMIDRMNTARDKLTGMGVWQQAIVGYLPRQPAPTTGDLIMLTARDTPAAQTSPGMKLVPPSKALAGADGPLKGNFVIDPFAEEGESIVDTEIKVTVWDAKGNKKQLLDSVEVTLKLGPNGIEEVGAEVAVLKRRIKNQMFFGLITKVDLSVKLEGTLKGIDIATAKNLVGGWAAEVKGSLEAELKIPKTSIVIKVEAVLGVDAAGQPVIGAKLEWEFD
jgi:hypothetical protein